MVDLANLGGLGPTGAAGPGPFSPDQLLRVRRLLARTPYYIDDNAFLRVRVSNVLAGAVVDVHLRLATPAGEVKATRVQVTPTADAMVTETDFALSEGLLLNVTAFASSGQPLIGQTFCQVQLLQARGTGATILANLLANYVTSTQGPGYPGSPPQTSIAAGGYFRGISGTVPAAGADISETCPTGRRWELVSVETQLLTSAAAGNRIPVLQWATAGLRVSTSAPVTTVAPSAGGTFNWSEGMPLAVAIQAGVNVSGLPSPTIILAGDRFFTQTTNLAAGDQYQYVHYTVREWLDIR